MTLKSLIANSPLQRTYQGNGQADENQHQVMKHQYPLLHKESLHSPERMALGWPGLTFDLLGIVVCQVHGVDVVGHVWSSKQSKPIDQPVAGHRPISIQIKYMKYIYMIFSFSNIKSLTCQSWCLCRTSPLWLQLPWPKQHEWRRPA